MYALLLLISRVFLKSFYDHYVRPCLFNGNSFYCRALNGFCWILLSSLVFRTCRLSMLWYRRRLCRSIPLEDVLFGPRGVCSRINRFMRYAVSRWVKLYHYLDFLVTVGDHDIERRVMYFSPLVSAYSAEADLRKLIIPQDRTININTRPSSHSHPVCAAFRSTANAFLTELAVNAGFTPYHVSKSARDEGEGTRFYYQAKDLLQKYQNDDLKEEHALIFTDVDYHANMPRWLNAFKPMLIYTLVPTAMTARTKEFYYRVVGDEVIYCVSGGAEYQHRLWKYSGDTLTHVNPHTGELYTFSIESRCIDGDPHHRVVFILPAARIPAPYWELLDVRQNPLKRWEFNGAIYDPIRNVVSLAYPGTTNSIEIPGNLYSAMSLKFEKSPLFEGPQIERMLAINKIPDPSSVGPVLERCLGRSLDKFDVLPTGTFPVNYYPTKGLVHDMGKPNGQVVTTPLVTEPALIPNTGYNSDLATVEGRINRPRNNVEPPGRYTNFANEFIKRLVPRTCVGYQWSIEQVAMAQNRPAQRNRLQQCLTTLSDFVPCSLKSFMKKEAYSSVNDPRNITTVPAEMTTLMSTMTYPFKEDVLKLWNFYAPGMTPIQICDRLATVSADGTISTDFSRFDGSISEWLQRSVVESAYLRWLPLELRPIFKKWFTELFKNIATTSNGITYRPGFGTRSGSPITTDGNTMINAFVYYCAYRKMNYSPDQALELIGILCGDDGVTGFVTGLDAMLSRVCADLGLKVEIEVKPRGPVNFCGRKFIDPVTMRDSHQDIKRTLAKLHLTTNMAVTREQAAINRATGYLSTDRLTPLISDYCHRVLELCPGEVKLLTHEEQYKLNMAWPQENVNAIADSICEDLGLTRSELTRRQEAIRNATSLDDFPVILVTQREIKLDAVVADEVCYTGNQLSKENNNEEDGERSKNSDDNPGGVVPVVRLLATGDTPKRDPSDGSGSDRHTLSPRGKIDTRAKGQTNNRGRRPNTRTSGTTDSRNSRLVTRRTTTNKTGHSRKAT